MSSKKRGLAPGPERKVADQPVRHDAEDPHLGASHRPGAHAMAVPEGLSTIAHFAVNKRARRDRKPRDETLYIRALTGCTVRPVTALQAAGSRTSPIPIFPWHRESFLFEWSPNYLPRGYTASAGYSSHYTRRPVAGDFDYHEPLIPYVENEAKVPQWSSDRKSIQHTPAGGYAVDTCPYLSEDTANATRLKVNGLYYQETLVFQGKIHIAQATDAAAQETLGAFNRGYARPWIRCIVIQFPEEDTSGVGANEWTLGDFFPRAPSDTLDVQEDPDYAQRRGEYLKGVTQKWNVPYKILMDHTWSLQNQDGSFVREIPIKMKFKPNNIKELLGAVEAGGWLPIPLDIGPKKAGRIIYQFFHNHNCVQGTEHISLHPVYSFWEGKWTLKIEDGNF